MGFQRKKGRRVTPQKSRRNCCIDELAKVIASMFDNGEPLEVLHQLYALIFKAKKATLISNGRKLLQFELRCAIGTRHDCFAQVEKWVEAEDYSALKIGQEEYEKFLTGLEKVEKVNISWMSDRDALLHLMKEFTAEHKELENIAAMTDVSEQVEAFADYHAKEKIQDISYDLEWIALGGTLGAQDIQRIIKTVYLDTVVMSELEALAQIFGRHDIIKICESPMDRMLRDDKRRKLLTVLRHRIAHKSQQDS